MIKITTLILFACTMQLSTYAQVNLEVEGKIRLHNDNESDTPQNGDIRWNENGNNGEGDFEGYVNGMWCSLTLKVIYGCDEGLGNDMIYLNGLPLYTTFPRDEENEIKVIYPDSAVFISECNCTDGLDDDKDGLIDCAFQWNGENAAIKNVEKIYFCFFS